MSKTMEECHPFPAENMFNFVFHDQAANDVELSFLLLSLTNFPIFPSRFLSSSFLAVCVLSLPLDPDPLQ